MSAVVETVANEPLSDAVQDAWNDLEKTEQHVAKKTRMKSYKNLLNRVDGTILEHAICCQMHEAHRLAEQRFDDRRLPSEAVRCLSVDSYRNDTICSNTCTAETVRIALYMVDWDENENNRRQMLDAHHMFFHPSTVQLAARLGIMTQHDCARRTLHVCSPYCPFVISQRDPTMMTDDDDEDRLWNSSFWHSTQLKSDYVPSILYRCTTHNRFHVCSSNCEYISGGQSGVKLCPISKKVVADEIKHSFGDGVGTAEQQEKSAEAKGGDEDTERRRRSIVNARTQLYASATYEDNGRRVRRGPGDRVTAVRRKLGQALRRTPEDQQTRQTYVASPAEVAACRPYNHKSTERELPMTISAIARVPFSERAAKDNHEFALDALHEMFHRVERRATFTFSEQISRRVLFGNPVVFATCCERAAAIFHHLLFGRERRAKEMARYEQSHVQAERSVEQFIARCEAAGTTASAAQCIAHYEATMNAKTRRYPAVQLSAELYATIEAYYAIRSVIFFFGLLSLPVRNRAMMRPDELDAITSAFGFESFDVVIYDLMHTGYGVRNVTNLARDNFIAERLFPSSTTLKQLGMLEKPVTNIKGIITTIFKAVQPNGISPQYVFDTTLSWSRIAQISALPNPARRVVEELLERRDAQLHELCSVRPPSPEPDEKLK